jgi:hypothetical protein
MRRRSAQGLDCGVSRSVDGGSFPKRLAALRSAIPAVRCSQEGALLLGARVELDVPLFGMLSSAADRAKKEHET